VRPVLPRRHYLLAAGIFLILGFHVGVYTVELAGLATALGLRPGELGGAVSVAATAGILTLVLGGRLADRFGRRPALLVGFAGTATAFTLLAGVHSLGGLVPVFALYGLTIGFVDLGANAVGSDYERAAGRHVMTGLHAGFSLGALTGAAVTASLLWAGIGFRAVYLLLAAVLAAAGLTVARAPMPLWTAAARDPRTRGVWRAPGVRLAIAVVTLTFVGDGALESFLGVYLRGSGILLTGAGIGGYHLASLLGRLLAARALRRWGERRVLAAGGALAAAGIAGVVSAPPVALPGLLTVGFAVAPIVPAALSLAGRSAPGRSAQAVATTTAYGYSAFVVGPALIGAIADVTGLRAALALLSGTSLAVAVLAVRWPVSAGGEFAGE
jgi:MFS family permease